jgi:hypothetical protein
MANDAAMGAVAGLITMGSGNAASAVVKQSLKANAILGTSEKATSKQLAGLMGAAVTNNRTNLLAVGLAASGMPSEVITSLGTPGSNLRTMLSNGGQNSSASPVSTATASATTIPEDKTIVH